MWSKLLPYNVSKTLSLLVLSTSLCALIGMGNTAKAQDYKSKVPRHYKSSTNETGTLGLNTLPNARMDEVGTIRLGVGTSDPYLHSFMGFQLAAPFYVAVRQTAEISNLTSDPKFFAPGIDFKLRLWEETATRPAFVVGMESAFGNKRMASEYVALSKRYKNFDFTGGAAWGRLGSAGHIKNPMRSISSHFGKERGFSNLQSNDMNKWFTGEEIGLFGGVEYFTPLNGLSVKADYGANDYIAESQTIDGFNAPDPWAISLNYKPIEQADLSFGVIGGEKIMARLSLQDQLFNWPGKSGQRRESPALAYPRKANTEGSNATRLSLSSYRPTGRQIGQAARLVANDTFEDAQSIKVAINHKGLKGPVVTLFRNDLERGIIDHQRSPEEIWRNAMIEDDTSSNWDVKKLLNRDLFKRNNFTRAFRFVLDQKLSLSESDTGNLYRTSALVEGEKVWPFGIVTGATARVNIANNLSNLNEYRFRVPEPTRSDEDLFAARRFGIDRLYSTWMKTIAKDTYAALSVGYLEEMYAGFGGEILYRPFGKRVAVGAEAWQVNKRDPTSNMNKIISTEEKHTGHLNLFYEMPNQDMTAYVKFGQYLREDRGGTFGLKKRFSNGSSLEGFVTASDQQDRDLLGNKTYVYGGIRFNLPFGNIPYVPDGSEIRFSTGPIARDSGQTLDKPQALYEVTEPIAYRNLSQSWQHLLD